MDRRDFIRQSLLAAGGLVANKVEPALVEIGKKYDMTLARRREVVSNTSHTTAVTIIMQPNNIVRKMKNLAIFATMLAASLLASCTNASRTDAQAATEQADTIPMVTLNNGMQMPQLGVYYNKGEANNLN